MLRELFHKFKWLLAFASVLSAAGAFAGVTMLSLITKSIESLSKENLDVEYPFSVFLVVVIFAMAFQIFSQYILLRLSSTIVYDVKKSMLQRVLATGYEKIEKIGGHRIMAVMEDDVHSLSSGLLMLPGLVSSAVTVFLCVGYMIYSSLQLFLFVAIFMLAIIVVSKTMLRYAMVHQTALRETSDTFFSALEALTNGGKEIKLNSNRRRFFYLIEMLPLFDEIREKTVKAETLFIILGTMTSIIVFFMIGSIVYGARFFLPELQIEILISFVLVVLYMVGPLSSLVGVMDQVNEIQVSLKKIEGLGLADRTQFELPPASTRKVGGRWASVRLEEVCFTYADSVDQQEEHGDQHQYAFSLGPLSTEFRAGEITFITGGNGSGKTTFAKLLCGLYSATSGDILLDGQIIEADTKLEDYKNGISAIFSDFFVFEQLLNDQGEPANDTLIANHINKLQLDHKVSTMGGKLSSINLSQGQRKRLMLLHSYSADAHVCLYDECAADQDPEFKRYFYTELLPELKQLGKIVIVISHDDHYFHAADKVIKFVDGVLDKSDGSHTENIIPC